MSNGTAIAAASSRGFAKSHLYLDTVVADIGKLVGDKFTVDSKGLALNAGETLDETQAGDLISTCAELTERSDTIVSLTMSVLGDAVVLVKDQFGVEAGERLIEQAVSIMGKSKHSIRDAEMVARAIPYEDRPDGLTFSHLRLLAGALTPRDPALAIPASTLSKIVDAVQDGTVVGRVQVDGKEVVQRKVLPVAAMRDMLKQAKGKPEKAINTKPENPNSSVLNLSKLDTPDAETSELSELRAELKDADAEIKRQELVIESLSKKDGAGEILILHGKLDALNGRITQLLATSAAATKLAKHRGEMLAKVRKALGVDRDGQILEAIKKLKQ